MNFRGFQVLNDKQKKNLWLGILAMVVMGIYPPWKEFGTVTKPSVFAPINRPPAIAEGVHRVDIDFSRLGIELFLATMVTGALVVTAAGRPDPPSLVRQRQPSLAALLQTLSPALQAAATMAVKLPRQFA